MMNWVYKWHNPKTDPNAEELTDAIVGIFLHGVRKATKDGGRFSVVGSAAIHLD
jgi:hypothetical protein